MGKKNKPIFGLSKLPDKAYIKALEERVSELEIERGKDQAYITELEDELKALSSKSKEELKEYRKSVLVNQLREAIGSKDKLLQTYKKDNKELIHQILMLKQKLNGKRK